MSSLRVALAHHWLVGMRGGEQVLDAMAELLPAADVFTLVYDRAAVPPGVGLRPVRSSFLQWLPRARSWYPYYLPLFPAAAARMDLRAYDLVISSDAATVKGVQTRAGATHICYCHTPMRYVWSGYESYRQSVNLPSRWVLSALRPSLCRWDYKAAQRVTHFVANSRNVQERIHRFYGRDSVVIYPPVDTERFTLAAGQTRYDFFLFVSQLVPYKRADLLVKAFNASNRRLVIIGDGPELPRLKAMTGSNIRFWGSQPQHVVVEAMQQCKALVFAGEEDFGIVMAEALACGTPVVAFGRGGAAEIVEHGRTGVLFQQQTAASLAGALDLLDEIPWDAARIRCSALRFSRKRFLTEFAALVSGQIAVSDVPVLTSH